MNHKAEFRKLKPFDWKRKSAIIVSYQIGEAANIRDVAKFFGISIGYVCEAIKLIEHWDDIKDIPTRTKALEKIK